MNVIKMHRDGAIAEVDTTHKKTYANFLAHGWVEATISADEPADTAEPTEVPTPESGETKTEESVPASKAVAATKGRKAR